MATNNEEGVLFLNIRIKKFGWKSWSVYSYLWYNCRYETYDALSCNCHDTLWHTRSITDALPAFLNISNLKVEKETPIVYQNIKNIWTLHKQPTRPRIFMWKKILGQAGTCGASALPTELLIGPAMCIVFIIILCQQNSIHWNFVYLTNRNIFPCAYNPSQYIFPIYTEHSHI